MPLDNGARVRYIRIMKTATNGLLDIATARVYVSRHVPDWYAQRADGQWFVRHYYSDAPRSRWTKVSFAPVWRLDDGGWNARLPQK